MTCASQSMMKKSAPVVMASPKPRLFEFQSSSPVGYARLVDYRNAVKASSDGLCDYAATSKLGNPSLAFAGCTSARTSCRSCYDSNDGFVPSDGWNSMATREWFTANSLLSNFWLNIFMNCDTPLPLHESIGGTFRTQRLVF